MTPSEKIEVAALAGLALAAALLTNHLPRRVALADLLLCGAMFLLVQGLVRDLGRLWRERAAARREAAPLRCVCLESTLGVGALVAGSVLLLAWTPIVVPAARAAWPLGVVGLGAFRVLDEGRRARLEGVATSPRRLVRGERPAGLKGGSSVHPSLRGGGRLGA